LRFYKKNYFREFPCVDLKRCEDSDDFFIKICKGDFSDIKGRGYPRGGGEEDN